jgi:hypothetical protein
MNKFKTVTMMAAQAAILAFPMTAHADVAHVGPVDAVFAPAPEAAAQVTLRPQIGLPFSGGQTQAASLQPSAIEPPAITLPLPLYR